MANSIRKPYKLITIPASVSQVWIPERSYWAAGDNVTLTESGEEEVVKAVFGATGGTINPSLLPPSIGVFGNSSLESGANNNSVSGVYASFGSQLISGIGGSEKNIKPVLLSPSSYTSVSGKMVTVDGYYMDVVTPARNGLTEDVGWNSSAESAAVFSGDGTVGFSVKDGIASIIAGLSAPSSSGNASLPNDILYGIEINGPTAAVTERGERKTGWLPFSPSSDAFKITRAQSTVTYYINDSIIYTSIVESNEVDIALGALFYVSGDGIIDGSIEDLVDISTFTAVESLPNDFNFISGGNLSANTFSINGDLHIGNSETLESGSEMTYEVSTAYFDTVIPSESDILITQPYEATANLGAGGFLAMAGMASEGDYSLASGEMLPLEGLSYAGYAGSYATGNGAIQPLSGSATGLTGGNTVDSSPQDMLPLGGVGANYSYGIASTSMLPISGSASEYVIPSYVEGSGAVRIFDGSVQFSGQVLASGWHIITSASEAETLLDLAAVSFEFNTFLDIESPEVYEIIYHPSWVSDLGANPAKNFNVAIISLKSKIDPRIERHDIYRLPVQSGTVFSRTAYGSVTDPATGDVIVGDDFQYSFNTYDLDANEVDVNAIGGNQLAYDFDSGLVANDALATYGYADASGLGLAEGIIGVGGLGAAALIGRQIAGIASSVRTSGADVNATQDSTYGEIGFDIDLAPLAEWIDQNSIGNEGIADNLALPLLKVEGRGHVLPLSIGAVRLPLLSASGLSGGVLIGALLPMPAVSGSGVVDNIGKASLRLPVLNVVGSVTTGAIGVVDVTLNIELSAYGYGGANGAARLPLLSVNSEAKVGSIGRAIIRLPRLRANGRGGLANYGRSTIRLPDIVSLYGIANIPICNISANGLSKSGCEVL